MTEGHHERSEGYIFYERKIMRLSKLDLAHTQLSGWNYWGFDSKLAVIIFRCKMNLIPDDTNIEEMRKQFEILQNMTGEQRLQRAFDLSDKARQELIDDIKKQHPEFTEQQIKKEIIRRCYGEELAQKVAAAKGWK